MKIAPSSDVLLREISDRLIRALEPEQIYLFGSRARDEGKPSSEGGLLYAA